MVCTETEKEEGKTQMIYVVVAHYSVEVFGRWENEWIEINKLVTTDRKDVLNIKDLNHEFTDEENESKKSVKPSFIDLELWDKGERIGVDTVKEIEQLKGAVKCE